VDLTVSPYCAIATDSMSGHHRRTRLPCTMQGPQHCVDLTVSPSCAIATDTMSGHHRRTRLTGSGAGNKPRATTAPSSSCCCGRRRACVHHRAEDEDHQAAASRQRKPATAVKQLPAQALAASRAPAKARSSSYCSHCRLRRAPPSRRQRWSHHSQRWLARAPATAGRPPKRLVAPAAPVAGIHGVTAPPSRKGRPNCPTPASSGASSSRAPAKANSICCCSGRRPRCAPSRRRSKTKKTKPPLLNSGRLYRRRQPAARPPKRPAAPTAAAADLSVHRRVEDEDEATAVNSCQLGAGNKLRAAKAPSSQLLRSRGSACVHRRAEDEDHQAAASRQRKPATAVKQLPAQALAASRAPAN
jgi:hypothetical protein